MARKDPISHLGRHPFELPRRLVDEILALGPAGLDQLVAIADDRERWTTDPVTVSNALAVLGHHAERQPPDEPPVGLASALRVHAEAEIDDLLYARAGFALDRMAGPATVDVLLAAHDSGDEVRRDDITMMLARCGAKDPRIARRLEDLVRRDPVAGAEACVDYGDPALVPCLAVAFEERVAEIPRDPEQVRAAVALFAAMSRLGSPDEGRKRRLTAAATAAGHRLLAREDELLARLERTLRG